MIYNKHNTGLHGEQGFIWGQEINAVNRCKSQIGAESAEIAALSHTDMVDR